MQVCSPPGVDHRVPLGFPHGISGYCDGGQCAEILSAIHAQSPMTRIKPGSCSMAIEDQQTRSQQLDCTLKHASSTQPLHPINTQHDQRAKRGRSCSLHSFSVNCPVALNHCPSCQWSSIACMSLTRSTGAAVIREPLTGQQVPLVTMTATVAVPGM